MIIEYDDAALYLKKRLELENRGNEKIKRIIVNAFKDLLALTFPCPLTAQNFRLDLLPNQEGINELLKDMRTQIYLTVVECCESVADQRKELYSQQGFPFVVADILEQGEDSIRHKSSLYSNRVTKEFETWIAMALFYKWSKNLALRMFTTNCGDLYKTNSFKKATTATKFYATRLKNGGVSYGVGHYQSSLKSLHRLNTIAIGATSKSIDSQILKKIGASGYNVYRGSSYPCAVCDFNVGFHPISADDLPPYHPNCCCFAVPV